MKTLVISGSPKKHSETKKLMDLLCLHLEGSVEHLNVFDQKHIHPCLDCKQCSTQAVCKQDDEFTDVLVKIEEADCIVLASPMWFGTISGPMMSYLSRLNILHHGYHTRNDRIHRWDKCAIFIMTTGARWESMAKPVETYVEFLCKEMDAMMLDCIYANKTDVLPANENKHAIEKCMHAAKRVNEWYQAKSNDEYIQYGYSSSNYMDYESNRVVSVETNNKGE